MKAIQWLIGWIEVREPKNFFSSLGVGVGNSTTTSFVRAYSIVMVGGQIVIFWDSEFGLDCSWAIMNSVVVPYPCCAKDNNFLASNSSHLDFGISVSSASTWLFYSTANNLFCIVLASLVFIRLRIKPAIWIFESISSLSLPLILSNISRFS